MIQPPTDSLYKFLAVFGLVLLGFGLWLPLQRYDAAAEQSARAEDEWVPLYPKVGQHFRLALLGFDCSRSPDDKTPLPAKCSELPELEAKWAAVSTDYSSALAEATASTRRTEFLVAQYKQYAWIGGGIGAVGAFLSALGFTLWYTRIQRFQDATLRSEAEGLLQRAGHQGAKLSPDSRKKEPGNNRPAS